MVVPVEVKWQEPSGKIFREAAQAMEVNAQGGLLDMKIYPWVGGDLELTNLLSSDSAKVYSTSLASSASVARAAFSAASVSKWPPRRVHDRVPVCAWVLDGASQRAVEAIKLSPLAGAWFPVQKIGLFVRVIRKSGTG